MAGVTLDVWTCDVGTEASSAEAYAAQIAQHTLESWHSGADAVLFPEYTWMGLARFVKKDVDILKGVSDLFWRRMWPGMQTELSHEKGKLVVLGTAPWAGATGGGIYNRAPILCNGWALYQDKLNLTPWENSLTRGDALQLFTFMGLTFAVVICLDIEVPELSALMRGRGVDCVLVPSATDSVLGVERVGRCASARAVELGCHVAVSHLVGRCDSELVDENVGRLGWYAPSQSLFVNNKREETTNLLTEGWHSMRVRIDPAQIHSMRRNRNETNPASLTPLTTRCVLNGAM